MSMLKVFNTNYEEVGSLNKNLVLNTQGKVKIRFNKKFIDLLDNNGNINVKIPKIPEQKNSVDDIKSDGFYIVDGILYVYYNEQLIQVTSSENEGNYIKYSEQQKLSQEQISQVQENIGLKFKTVQDAINTVTNGIVFIDNKLYYINNGSIYEIPDIKINQPISDINNLEKNPTIEDSVILWRNKKWQYVPLEISDKSGSILYSPEFDSYKYTTTPSENLNADSFPRYTSKLNEELAKAADNSFDNVIPTISWVKSELGTSTSINDRISYLEDKVIELEQRIEALESERSDS